MQTKMQLTVTTYVREAIRAGLAFGYKERVEIDLSLLTDNERAYLADTVTGCGDKIEYPHAIIPTPDNLLQSIREQAARKEAEEQAEIALAIRDAQDTLAKPVGRSYHNSHRGKAYEAYENYPGMRERRAQCEANDTEQRQKRIEAEHEAQLARDKEYEESQRLKAERIEQLRAWGMEHGSDLLKARIEGDYTWQSLAHDEFVAHHALPGFEQDRKEYHSCGRKLAEPNLKEIEAYKQAVALVAGNNTYGEVCLMRCTKNYVFSHRLTIEVFAPTKTDYIVKLLRQFDKYGDEVDLDEEENGSDDE